MFVTTIRDSFVYWELWSKRTNWYFFRELFSSNYVPKYFTHYNIVWQRSENFKLIEPITLDCKVELISDNETHLIFENFNITRDFVADVKIEYHVELNKTIFPIIGNRFLIDVQDLFEVNNELKTRSNYRISPYLNTTNLMLEHRNSDTKNVLKIFATPKNRTKLNVKSCNAKVIRFYNEEEEIRKLFLKNFSAFNLTDENWQNGISIKSNGFFIEKNSNIIINVGDTFEFPTGIRKVLDVQYAGNYINIFVDGERLSPIKDGYPNKIKLIGDK